MPVQVPRRQLQQWSIQVPDHPDCDAFFVECRNILGQWKPFSWHSFKTGFGTAWNDSTFGGSDGGNILFPPQNNGWTSTGYRFTLCSREVSDYSSVTVP